MVPGCSLAVHSFHCLGGAWLLLDWPKWTNGSPLLPGGCGPSHGVVRRRHTHTNTEGGGGGGGGITV